eukprot:s3442_g5.t1
MAQPGGDVEPSSLPSLESLPGYSRLPCGRQLANDLVVSVARQVRALRSVTAGLTRDGPPRSAGPGRARGSEPPPVPEPPAPPARRERERTALRRPCKEEQEDEDAEEESEEEQKVRKSPAREPDHRPLRDDRPRSPPPSSGHLPGTMSL